MGCGCSKGPNRPKIDHKKEPDKLAGKNVLDINNNILLINAPIYDVYKDIIGYIAKDRDGKVVRIFAKNVIKVLD